MEKRYYIAALFALGLAIQPATLHANTADENNGVETVQQQRQRISGLLTDSNGDPVIGATVRVQGTVTSTDDIPSKLSPVKCWNSAISDSSA